MLTLLKLLELLAEESAASQLLLEALDQVVVGLPSPRPRTQVSQAASPPRLDIALASQSMCTVPRGEHACAGFSWSTLILLLSGICHHEGRTLGRCCRRSSSDSMRSF